MQTMNPLFLGLLIAGVVLVIGVVLINWLQERRVPRRIDAAFGKPGNTAPAAGRVEPMLHGEQDSPDSTASVDTTDMAPDDSVSTEPPEVRTEAVIEAVRTAPFEA